MIKSALGALLAATLVLTGCQDSKPAAATQDYPSGPVTMTAGANPGSGFDITIRAVVEALQKERLVDVPLPVQNRPGGIGAQFLATMVEQCRGKDDQVSVTSLSMMMNELRGLSEYGYTDVTMIARLMTEYYVVVTGAGSPYKNLTDVMAAVKADPAVPIGAATDDQAPSTCSSPRRVETRRRSTTCPSRAAATKAPPCATARSPWRSRGSAKSSTR